MSLMLRDVLGSLDVDALVEGMADRRLIHRSAACAVPPETVFSLEELERTLLREGTGGNDLRITVNGRPADLELLGVMKDEQLRPLVLRQLSRQGVSIIVNNLHRYVPKLWALAADAERVLQDRVDIGGIASFSKLPALPPHYDAQDLIIVQVEGSKIWRFFGEPTDCAMPSHKGLKAPKDVAATVTMRAGDVMFVPAGLHHQCEAEGVSLHIGLLVRHATLLDFLGDLCREHPALNRPLRPLLGAESLVRQMEALETDLAARLEESDVVDWLAEWNARRARVTGLDLRRHSDPDSAEGIASLTMTMIPPGRPGRSWKVGGSDFKPDAGALAVVTALREGPLSVRELLEIAGRQVGPDQGRAGLDQLVAKGLVRVAPPSGVPEPGAGSH
ncbi:MAG TPA: cupin domain-containing protein [Allosphingosinicella sp.]|nr:cupin domain-containing protein [Allosphingosinicella sp.]